MHLAVKLVTGYKVDKSYLNDNCKKIKRYVAEYRVMISR